MLENFIIRKAVNKDLKAIEEIIEKAQNLMLKRNNPQWSDGYPQLDLIKEDIKLGRLYVASLKNGPFKIVGMIVIQEEKDLWYEKYDFWSEGEYICLHRVISLYSGLGRFFFNYATEKAKKENKYIRVDTHEKNYKMQNLIESFGFKEVGRVDCGYNDYSLAKAYELKK